MNGLKMIDSLLFLLLLWNFSWNILVVDRHFFFLLFWFPSLNVGCFFGSNRNWVVYRSWFITAHFLLFLLTLWVLFQKDLLSSFWGCTFSSFLCGYNIFVIINDQRRANRLSNLLSTDANSSFRFLNQQQGRFFEPCLL